MATETVFSWAQKKGLQTFSLKGQIVNVFDFVGYMQTLSHLLISAFVGQKQGQTLSKQVIVALSQ
jgi:hypothetical protein